MMYLLLTLSTLDLHACDQPHTKFCVYYITEQFINNNCTGRHSLATLGLCIMYSQSAQAR